MILALTLIMAQAMPDTSLRLQLGDTWETETTIAFRGDDVDMSQVETTKFAVIRNGNRVVMRSEWRQKETRIDGNVVPVPKDVPSLVRMTALSGEDLDSIEGSDIQRLRIERAIAIERKGTLVEPIFFPPPANVRLIGLRRIVELDLRNKEKPLLAVSIQESAGEKPLKGIGYYALEPRTGILLEGHWTLQNCPIPGGNTICEAEVTKMTSRLKLAPRKTNLPS